MVTRRRYEFELSPLESERIRVPATCINASLPIPTVSDRFVGVAQVPPSVRKFIAAAEGEDAMVVQAGVWALTDGLSRSQIQGTLRTRRVSIRNGIPVNGDNGSDEGPAISDKQIDRAREIMRSVGIPCLL